LIINIRINPGPVEPVEANGNFQPLVNQLRNPTLASSDDLIWQSRLPVRRNEFLMPIAHNRPNFSRVPQRVNPVIQDNNNVIDSAENRIENASAHVNFWNLTNNVLSFLNLRSNFQDFTQNITQALINALLGIISNRINSMTANIINRSTNQTISTQTQPEINQSSVPLQISRPSAPTLDMSDWVQGPN